MTRETIYLIRECQARDPANEIYELKAVAALVSAGVIERDALRWEEAQAYFDQAAIVLEASANIRLRQRLAPLVSDAYLQLENRLARENHPEDTMRAKDGRLRLCFLSSAVNADRPRSWWSTKLVSSPMPVSGTGLVGSFIPCPRRSGRNPWWCRETTWNRR